MEDLTCPNCNVDADKEELRRSNGMCPTCGFDMSGAKDDEEDWEEEEDDEDEGDEEDEEEEEDDDDEDEEE